jgi:hypothetical protein
MQRKIETTNKLIKVSGERQERWTQSRRKRSLGRYRLKYKKTMNVSIENHKIIFLVQLSILLFFFTGCKNKTSNHLQTNHLDTLKRTNDSANQIIQDSIKTTKTSRSYDYFFEPDISVISGTLKAEMYYGPPNYGDSPETDSKEYSYILYPDHAINVIQKSNKKDDFNFTTNNVVKFQLAPISDISLHSLVGKKIKVTGTFFCKLTGHHHTDVLLAVTKAESI